MLNTAFELEGLDFLSSQEMWKNSYELKLKADTKWILLVNQRTG